MSMTTFLPVQPSSETARQRALWMSTIAFTTCFAVWTIFSIIGIRIKQELGLNETQFGLLVGTPILAGSLARLVLGIWTGRYGGRVVFTFTMLAAAAATFLLAHAATYAQMLFAALGVGLAGGSFAVGMAYVSRFFPAERQGKALGLFGAGNVGAASRTSWLLSCFSLGAGRLSLRCGPEPSPSWLLCFGSAPATTRRSDCAKAVARIKRAFGWSLLR